MKTDPNRDDFLKDVLAAENTFRQASLENTLASARRHRLARRTLKIGGAVAACVILIVARTTHEKATAIVAKNSLPLPSVEPTKPTVPGTSIRLVTDDELLAMFPNRPVALVGPPDHRQLVFLDEHPPRKGQNL